MKSPIKDVRHENFVAGLGISKTKHEEIAEFLQHTVNDSGSKLEILDKVIGKYKKSNELVLAIVQVGRFMGKKDEEKKFHALAHILVELEEASSEMIAEAQKGISGMFEKTFKEFDIKKEVEDCNDDDSGLSDALDSLKNASGALKELKELVGKDGSPSVVKVDSPEKARAVIELLKKVSKI